MSTKTFLLHAYYCPGPFYWGWWMSADLIENDEPNHNLFESQWLKMEWMLEIAKGYAEQTGAANLPAVSRFGHDLAKAFYLAFPLGLILEGSDWNKADLVYANHKVYETIAQTRRIIKRFKGKASHDSLKDVPIFRKARL